MEKLKEFLKNNEKLLFEEKMLESKEFGEVCQDNMEVYKGLISKINEVQDEKLREELSKKAWEYYHSELEYTNFSNKFAYYQGGLTGYSFALTQPSIDF